MTVDDGLAAWTVRHPAPVRGLLGRSAGMGPQDGLIPFVCTVRTSYSPHFWLCRDVIGNGDTRPVRKVNPMSGSEKVRGKAEKAQGAPWAMSV